MFSSTTFSSSRRRLQRAKPSGAGEQVESDQPGLRRPVENPLVGRSSDCIYFSYGTRLAAYRGIDSHVSDRVRSLLVKRHKLKGRGTRPFSNATVFGELGVLSLGTLSA